MGGFRPGPGIFRHAGVIVVAALIGYLVTGLGLDRKASATAPLTPRVPPTPTIARAVTFTPTAFVLVTPSVASTFPSAITGGKTPVTSPTLAPSETPSPTPDSTLTPQYYVVQPGDTIEGISKKLGVSQDAIIRANALQDPNRLSQGQKLVIPR